LRKTAYRD